MAWAAAPQTSSDELSASAQISSMRSFLYGVELNPPSTGLATLKLYDSENSTITGKKLILSCVVAAGQSTLFITFPSGRSANRGIYAALTGTTTYIIGYNLS
jgi:hypothetical protein